MEKIKTQDLLDMRQQLLEFEGDSQAVHDTLESVEASIDQKLDAMAWAIDELDIELAPLKARLEKVDKLKASIKAIENRQDAIKTYINYTMGQMGKEKIITDKHVFKYVRRGGQQARILDETKIPKEFFKEQLPRLMTSQVRDALKEGKDIPGAELYQPMGTNIK